MKSHHGQCRLNSIIASMTPQRHHTMANVALVAPSLARLGSTITSMTRQQHLTMANVITTKSLPTPRPASPRQRLCQHCFDNAITSMTQGLVTHFPN
jgi:hypothetical protein